MERPWRQLSAMKRGHGGGGAPGGGPGGGAPGGGPGGGGFGGNIAAGRAGGRGQAPLCPPRLPVLPASRVAPSTAESRQQKMRSDGNYFPPGRKVLTEGFKEAAAGGPE